MSLESNLYSLLSSDVNITAIVSARIYPVTLPQGAALPALTYSRISTTPEYTHDGAEGIARARVQIDCWAERHATALSLAQAVLGALVGATDMGVSFFENEVDLYEPERGIYHRVLDMIVWYHI
jgi:hypothetical protein